LIDNVEGAVLADQVKSLDWAARNAELHSTAPADLLRKVRTYVMVLLGLRG
jgi:mRNA-degrading endonuclease toxin of MazEF toxin-antitoxin module